MGRRRVRADARGDDAQRRHARRPARAEARLPRLDRRCSPSPRRCAARRPRRSSSILARGLQGIGGAGMFAVSLAIIAQEFHGRERGTAFGIWGATIGIAVAIGPLVGGALTTYAGWRWIFFVNVPIGVAVVAGGMRELRESRERGARRLRPARLRHAHGGAVRARDRAVRGNDWGWSSGRDVGLFAAARRAARRVRVVELRQRAPMFDFSLFRVPTFTGAQIVAFAISAGMFSLFLFLTLYLQNVARLLADRRPACSSCRSRSSRSSSRRSRGGCRRAFPVRVFLGGGLALVGVALLLMHGLTPSSTGRRCSPASSSAASASAW